MRTEEFEIVEIGVDLGFAVEASMLPTLVL
jgi:hypothetical protein